ncbi:2-aminoethylphosphonate--pyruvate transaminase-like [Babylonia areolata]|uniref:2-aminoethylphosphonate--pyruvate transaminase-like n=1 Tax=Babylonia areolata TaxID=304850 RepID=UPI003FD45C28
MSSSVRSLGFCQRSLLGRWVRGAREGNVAMVTGKVLPCSKVDKLQVAEFSVSAPRPEDKKLFTPGPLGVSLTVKEAMLRDLGSRDVEFVSLVKYIRSRLVQISGVSEEEFTCVPIQGSGTFAVEAVFQTAVPRNDSKVLILENGAYGKRMSKICGATSIPYHMESFPENERVNLQRVAELLKSEKFSLVSCVHCETSSGVINPVEEVGQLIKALSPDTVYFVDAMSSFGAVPLDFEAGKVDFMVSSANKCMQGVPGFSYAVARKSVLSKCKGNSRSLSLDLHDQNEGLDSNGQFRFTPATHAMLAFRQALVEFDEEGGLEGRANRYKENHRVVTEGMKRLGFKELLEESAQGYIITSYFYPKDPNFSFLEFYNRLNEKGQVIYPGKTLDIDCFRIGNIGHLFPQDMEKLLQCVEQVCKDMNMSLPVIN